MTRRILYAWELGGGAGHVMRMLPVAEELRARGAEVTVAVRNLASGQPLIGAGFNVVEAPRLIGDLDINLRAFNYAEILIRVGYRSAENIRTMIAAWADLIATCRADLVVADFAPGALLGARVAAVRAATVGTGFALPPPGTPLPSIRAGQTPPRGRPQQSEADVFAQIGAALATHRASSAPDLASYFNTGRDILCVFRELDHAGHRGQDAAYAGPVFSSPPDSPLPSDLKAPDVFAYLNGDTPSFEAMIKALAATNFPALAVVRGRPRFNLKTLIAPNLRITFNSVNVPRVLAATKVAVCHGGMGLVSQALLAGVPLVIEPQNPEQGGTGQRIAAMGAGRMISGQLTAATIATAIRSVKDEARYAEAAQTFAGRYRDYDVASTVSGIADKLMKPF